MDAQWMIIAYCYGLCAVGSPQSVVQSSQVGTSGLTLPTGQQAENQFCICEVIAGALVLGISTLSSGAGCAGAGVM